MDKKTITGKAKGVENQELVLSGVIGSTGTIDRHGESVNPDGWSLKNFLKNPVILLNHQYHDLPVGKALKVWVEDKKLKFNVQLANTKIGKEVYQLFNDEILNAFSVGFIPVKWGVSGEDKYTIMEQELLELSVVTVPANPEALAKSLNIKKKTIEDRLERLVKLFEKEEKGGKPDEENKKPAKPETPKEDLPKAPKEEGKPKEKKKVKSNVVFLTKEETKELFKELMSDFITSYKEVKETPVKKEKKKTKKIENDEDTKKMLKSLQKELKGTDKTIGLTLKSIKDALKADRNTNLKNEGGENK